MVDDYQREMGRGSETFSRQSALPPMLCCVRHRKKTVMKRTISSAAQSAFKMFTLFFCAVFVINAISWSLSAGRVLWKFILPFGDVLEVFLWLVMSRKTVQMDDRFLYVSVFRRVVQIPLDQIAKVTETVGSRDRAVTVHFHSDTPCGRAITFSPTLIFGRESHPIVAELSSHIVRE